MLTISTPLSASQARRYHREEFANGQANYYSECDIIRGQWHGKLAEQWGLQGEVREEQFSLLASGQHPTTGELLVRHNTPREYVNKRGEKVRTMEHRAGWDATFSAPKSASLTALVGGDVRVRQAHRESVKVALGELENYVQARIGGNHPAETTSKWIAASFEHDSARPVDGYAAPHLHTHVVVFNLTETEDGETRALQPHQLHRSGQYATAIYRSELALRLKELGHGIERGKSCQPEIKGYTREYLAASSPRSQQIKEHLEQRGMRSAAATKIAKYQTREKKLTSITHEEMQERHRELAARFGDQPEQVVSEARARQVAEQNPEDKHRRIQSGLTYSCEKNFERLAVVDERYLMQDSLKWSMGYASFPEVRNAFEQQTTSGDLIERQSRSPARAFTTHRIIEYERDTIAVIRAGQQECEPLVSSQSWRKVAERQSHLSARQRTAVEQVLSSQDKVVAIDGVAGAGKIAALAAIREAAEQEGHEVRGLAPTLRDAHRLAESGIDSGILQRHLLRKEQVAQKRLYILDLSSVTASRQLNDFLHRMQDGDRVVLVRDKQQHDVVEAGGTCQQLQQGGMQTAGLDEIVRQKDPALKKVVERLSGGSLWDAVNALDTQGRVHEIVSRDRRLTEIAREYAREPKGTLVVSPDNKFRRELNTLIHRAMQERGELGREEHRLRVLEARQQMIGADRPWARQYEAGDVIRYFHGSKRFDIFPGEYARVKDVEVKENRITIERDDGEQQSYDPRRISDVAVYREVDRSFSEGDRVQFTAPSKDMHVAKGELGTIQQINGAGDLDIRMDSGLELALNIRKHPHVDHGYAVTTCRSRGPTAYRVLIHLDTEKSELLIDNRFACVAVSRKQYDAQIYTNDRIELVHGLGRDLSRRTPAGAQEYDTIAQKVVPLPLQNTEHEREQEYTQGIEFGIGIS